MRFWMTTLCLSLLFIIAAPITAQNDSPPRSITSEDAANLRILTLLAHHVAPITEMSFSPDGTGFLSASLDGQLCVWNVARRGQTPGELRFCLEGYAAGVTLFAWAADGRQLAVTLGDGMQIAIYEVADPINPADWGDIVPKTMLPVNDTTYLSLMWLPDGSRLFAHDLFDRFTLFGLDTTADDEPLAAIEGTAGVIGSTGSRAAVLDFDGNLILLNTTNGEEIGTAETDGANHVLFSPGARWLVTWDGDSVEIWDTVRFPTTRSLDAQADNVQFTPDGRFLATWEGQDIRLWNIETGETTGTLPEHRGGVRLLTFGANGTRAMSINAQGYSRYWDISNDGVPTLNFWVGGEIDDVLVGPDSNTLIVLRQDIEARFWDFARGQVRGIYDLSNAPLFSPDWSLVAISSGNLMVWHGLRDDPRIFDWMPIGFTSAITNIRPTPSQELQRIGVLPANTPVFAISRTEDATWLKIQLPDGSTGWIQPATLQLNGEIETLPISLD